EQYKLMAVLHFQSPPPLRVPLTHLYTVPELNLAIFGIMLGEVGFCTPASLSHRRISFKLPRNKKLITPFVYPICGLTHSPSSSTD
uniref:Uncharacterized protein n=1 Tax=Varanus komodoensis TaxID=61221 RepID=A0A8D2IZF0_VARKO